MSESRASLDAHAYVDQSLKPGERDAFEAALRRDSKLRARVDAWEAQNEAIRLAFGAAPRARAPSLGRPSNENIAKPRIAELAPPRRRFSALARRPAPWRWRALAAGTVLFAGLFGFAGGAVDPRPAMIARAETTLRASGFFPDARLDFVSDNPVALSAWLSGRFGRHSPDRLLPPGWSLLGARVVPGVAAAAAMVLYEDALGGRAALILEPTDALEDMPAQIAHGDDETVVAGVASGVLYAAVGPRRSGVSALAPKAFAR